MAKQKFRWYTFQLSKIFEGSADNLDSSAQPVHIKAKSEQKARTVLAKPSIGRSWILTDTKAVE